MVRTAANEGIPARTRRRRGMLNRLLRFTVVVALVTGRWGYVAVEGWGCPDRGPAPVVLVVVSTAVHARPTGSDTLVYGTIAIDTHHVDFTRPHVAYGMAGGRAGRWGLQWT
jgi:hypothetical protein